MKITQRKQQQYSEFRGEKSFFNENSSEENSE